VVVLIFRKIGKSLTGGVKCTIKEKSGRFERATTISRVGLQILKKLMFAKKMQRGKTGECMFVREWNRRPIRSSWGSNREESGASLNAGCVVLPAKKIKEEGAGGFCGGGE